MNRFFCTLLCFSTAFGAGETRVAVIDLLSGNNTTPVEVKAISDAIRSRVVSSPLRLIDRARVDALMNSSRERCAESECAVRIGKLVSADKVIYGVVSRIGHIYTIDTEYADVQTGTVERKSRQIAPSFDRIDEAAAAAVNEFVGVKGRPAVENPVLGDTRVASTEVHLALAPFGGFKYSVASLSDEFRGTLATTGLMLNVDTTFFGMNGFRVMFGYELSIAPRPFGGIDRVFLLSMLDLGAFFLTRLSPELYAGIGFGYKFESALQRKVYLSVPGVFADDDRARRGEIFSRAILGYTLWLSDTFGVAAEGYAGYSFFEDNAGASHYIDAGISIRTVFRIYKSLK
ncbi:MAG: hypothetical protein AABZ39_07430 [Spirochaetota bacterium]